MKIARKPLDDTFSLLIRNRAHWRCEACGDYFGSNRGSLHASHYHSRRKQSTRYDPQNVFAHCFSCHLKLGDNRPEFDAWALAKLGDSEYELLALRANEIVKRTAADKKELLGVMKVQLKWMQSERANGNMGRLEFELHVSQYENAA